MEDPLKYLPNPDMLEKSIEAEKDSDAIYRPPKFAPTTMEEDKMCKQEKQALRKEKDSFQKAKQSAYLRALRNELEGRSEEVKETYGIESRELTRCMAKMEECAKQEEEHFIRAPITKTDKMREKHLKKSRNGYV
ncbi:hypothetical protein Syun_022308 [Stephania yunnanensis]|uniref:Uncharacterized protein n=1 Tax=Stephania yunnanensis TaxID=152371 RepID=A0AAP0F9C9_9MAGN